MKTQPPLLAPSADSAHPPATTDGHLCSPPFEQRERVPLRSAWLLGLAAAVLVSLTYTLLVFNRSLPVQDGWFHIIADRMAHGQVPYRDFHLFLQPAYPLLIDALVDLFGHVFVVVRALGVLERVALTIALYLLFSRIGRPWAACAAAVVTVMTFSSFTADGVESYLQLCLALALFGVYFVGLALETRHVHRSIGYAAVGGLLLGLAFFLKQTTGLMIAVAALLTSVFILYHRHDKRYWWAILSLLGGAFLVAAAFAAWLLVNSAWHDYINQVWLGSSSKGSLWTVAFGFLHHSLPWTWFLGFAILLAIAAPWTWVVQRHATPGIDERGAARSEVIAAAATGMGLLLSVVIPFVKRDSLVWFASSIDFFNTKRMIITWAFLGAAIASLWLALQIERRGASPRRGWLLLMAVVSAAAAWATSMSYAIDEAAALPCLGFFVLLVLDARAPRQLAYMKNAALLAMCCLTVLTASATRYATPYYWWGWLEPDVATATEGLPYAEATALRVSPATADAYRTILTRIDRSAPRRAGSVYTFPHMGVFYVLSGRYPTTEAIVNYWDVCPDEVARRDAALLLERPPEVIVWMELPEDVWIFHEAGFRDGRRSGQRAIKSAVERMVADRMYRLVDKVVSPGCYPILVYVRTDRL